MPGNTFDEVDTQGVLIERGDVPLFHAQSYRDICFTIAPISCLAVPLTIVADCRYLKD